MELKNVAYSVDTKKRYNLSSISYRNYSCFQKFLRNFRFLKITFIWTDIRD